MAVDVILPRVDMDMTSAKISRWLASDGTAVRQGDPLFEIETDKATMEIEAATDGVLRHLPDAQVGQDVPIGSVVATILQPGEALPQAAPAVRTLREPPGEAAAPPMAPAAPTAAIPTPVAEKLLRATPLARRLAREMPLALSAIRGRGPRGRIVADDVRLAQPPAQPDAMPRPSVAAAGTGDLHTLRSGQAGDTPVLFLHGFGSEATVWRPLWGLLGTGRPLLAPDLPGHGKSAGSGEVTMEALVEAVLGVLRRERMEAVHLVGHSLGGAVAARIAAQGLADVRSLLLLAPAGLGPEIDGAFLQGFLRARQEASLHPWIERLFADASHVRQGLLRSVLDAHKDPACLGFRERLAAALFPDGTQSPALRAAQRGPCALPDRLGLPGRDHAAPPCADGAGAHRPSLVRGHGPHVEDAGAVARIHLDLVLSVGAA